MLEIIKTLKDTPLPIVLVIGGLIFLLIPFIQKINAKEVGVETTNQSLAGVIGFLLLVIGIGLYIIPTGAAASNPPTAISAAEAPQAIQPTDIVQPSVLSSTTQIPTQNIPVIIPTLAPISIGTISVPGNSSEGIKFNVTQTGIYIFKYVSGSYSTYPENKTPPAGVLTWLTAIRVFKNRPTAWNGDAISEQNDYRIVDFAYFASASEAEATAKGHSLTISLSNGDYLILVAVDGKQYYSDNPGEVILEVLYTPNQ